jgi:hypothetical protein
MVDRKGFDAQTWKTTKAFSGRCATPQDVEVGGAVFALADTHHGHPIDMALPSPVIWYEEDEEFAALAVQAESHESEDGEELEVLGLILPGGRTAVAFVEDVEFVTDQDHTWLALLEADLEIDDEDDDDVYDPDEDDYVGPEDEDDDDDDDFDDGLDDAFDDDDFDDDEDDEVIEDEDEDDDDELFDDEDDEAEPALAKGKTKQ